MSEQNRGGADAKQARSIQISKKATAVSAVLVGLFFLAACVLTLVLKPGVLVEQGGEYLLQPVAERPMQWWQYVLSPLLVLTPMYANCATVWSIVLLAVIIGAVFSALDASGVLVYLVETLARKYAKKKYTLLILLSFVMMFLGTTIGVSEEVIPLVPLVVMLFYALGWDSPLALMASSLAACAGFTVGVINPFNTGIAQSLTDELPMYSGVGYRIVLFFLFYAVLAFFLLRYAKRIDRDPASSICHEADERRRAEFGFDIASLRDDPAKDRALRWFGAVLGTVVVLALVIIGAATYFSKLAERDAANAAQWDGLSSALSGSILYFIILGYTVAGVGACIRSGLKGKALLAKLGEGTVTLLPTAAMILLASAIGYVFQTSMVSDTIVWYTAAAMENGSGFGIVLLLFAFLFLLEFFIPSASGKAFLIMPLVYKLCTLLGIDHQLAVLCFLFADGFANSLLPTNSGVLITLGLTPVSYTQWLRRTAGVFASFFALAAAALAFGYYVLY